MNPGWLSNPQTASREAAAARHQRVGSLFLSLLMLLTALGRPSSLIGQSVVPTVLQEVGIEQKLDEQLPLHLVFRDESGQPVALEDYFGDRPVVLALVYYECPMLCTLVLNGLLKSLRALPFDVGREFEVVTVSIDPTETSAIATQKKASYVEQYARPGAAAGWHFLTGEETSIRQLAQAVGFRYSYDPETGLYAHASGIMVATPRGRLARYYYGIEYSARDLRLGLIEASANRIGSPVDQVLLYCFQYDPTTGRYGLVIMNTLRLAGLATVLALGLFLVLSLRRERSQRLSRAAAEEERKP